MPDALTTITRLIQSPPGQLAAGGVLAGIVWKFFERVEAVLTETTKLEIAVWLLDASSTRYSPAAIAAYFIAICGSQWMSRRLVTIGIATGAVAFVFACIPLAQSVGPQTTWRFRSVLRVELSLFIVCTATAIAALSFLQLRLRLGLRFLEIVLVIIWSVASDIFSLLVQYVYVMSGEQALSSVAVKQAMPFFPVFAVELAVISAMSWLWLYAVSGFILKAARRFDIGFEWFNRKFDIEKKPLQSIGLVAGALVAVTYWAAVIVSRFAGRSA
jgi:hypothetical protein